MVTLLVGENSFELSRALADLTAGFSGDIERFEAGEVEVDNLANILMSMSLFADKRLVIIKNIGSNKNLWDALPEWLGKISDDVQLVLTEEKPDRRTKAWKAFQKGANIQEFKLWGRQDEKAALAWLEGYARERGLEVSRSLAQYLLRRVGLDQWALAQAIDKLSLLENISQNDIDDQTELSVEENVFGLFELALGGKLNEVSCALENLRKTEDPYRLFGLVSGQALQLAALVSAPDSADVAADFGVHAFALSKMRSHAKKMSIRDAGEIVSVFLQADIAIKTNGLDPWLALEGALLKLGRTAQKNRT